MTDPGLFLGAQLKKNSEWAQRGGRDLRQLTVSVRQKLTENGGAGHCK